MTPTDAVVLGYTFKDGALLERAVTHPSVSRINYQELEFLGDSIVGAVVAEKLFGMIPEQGEGALTRAKSRVVSELPLAEAADRAGLTPLIKLGEAEKNAGVGAHASVRSDVFEAVTAAIYLDGGMGAAAEFVLRALGDDIAAAAQDPGARDPKTALNEYAQRRGMSVNYEEISRTGSPHAPEFHVRVLVAGSPRGEGRGASKREAQERAAAAALAVIRAGKRK